MVGTKQDSMLLHNARIKWAVKQKVLLIFTFMAQWQQMR